MFTHNFATMDKTKFALYILLLLSIFIVLGAIICCDGNKCCNVSNTQKEVSSSQTDSNFTKQKKYNEILLRKIQSYTISFTDSLKKQDSIYNDNLQEIITLFRRKALINKTFNDSCNHCTCQENNTYEFSNYSYYRIYNKLTSLQKSLSIRKTEIQIRKEILETIMNDSVIYSQSKGIN